MDWAVNLNNVETNHRVLGDRLATEQEEVTVHWSPQLLAARVRSTRDTTNLVAERVLRFGSISVDFDSAAKREVAFECLQVGRSFCEGSIQPTYLKQLKARSPNAGVAVVKSPITGTVLTVDAAAGTEVSKGQVLMVIEAMKMENRILAPQAGTLTEIHGTPAEAVKTGEVLAKIKPTS